MNTIKAIFAAFSQKEKVVFLVATLFFLAGITTFGVLFFLRSTEVVPARGGEYIEGMVGQPAYINPVIATSDPDKTLAHLLFADLPQLADNIEAENGGRTIRVRLKEGLTWTDGQKITADDVVFTIQKIQDPDAKSPLAPYFTGATAKRVSELEVLINLVSPYAFFEDHLQYLHILPKHIFGETPVANWKLSKYNLEPVGSGPYKLQLIEKEATGFIRIYRLVANKDFAGGEPYIYNFDVQFFSKTEDMVGAFNNGTISGFGTFDPGTTENVHRSHELSEFPLPSYYAVFFNQDKNPVLKDAVVRQALHDALQPKDIADQAFQGKAQPIDRPLDALLPDTQPISRPSLDAVRTSLEKDGWVIDPTNAEGPRIKKDKNGTSTLELALTVPKIQFLQNTAALVQKSWHDIGVKVDVEEVSLDDVANISIKQRDYQALLFGNILNPPLDLYAFWHSNEKTPPGLNLAMYSNSKADEFIEKIRRELDPGKRMDELKQLNELIAADNPAIFLYAPHYFIISTKDLHGLGGEPLLETTDRFLRVNEWYLKTSRKLK